MYYSTQGDVSTMNNHSILKSKYFDRITYKIPHIGFSSSENYNRMFN